MTIRATHRALLTSAFLLLLLASAMADDPALDAPSAYEMVERFGFPRGILPKGVQSYVLRPDGSFEVLLRSDCEFKVESDGYLLSYKKKISGKVASGSLTELRGVSVKVFFIWFSINDVVQRDNDLYFYVGPLSASFPVANFMECPQCRCGFDCSARNRTDVLVAEA